MRAHWSASDHHLVATSLGQATGENTAFAAGQTADLLAQARRAMAANDLATADKLIAQAESLHVEYSPITMEDTPRKARQALERFCTTPAIQARCTRVRVVKTPRRPIRSPAGRMARGRRPGMTFACRRRWPGNISAPPPAANDANDRAQSDRLLRLARRALAVGDVAPPAKPSMRPSGCKFAMRRWTTVPSGSKARSTNINRPWRWIRIRKPIAALMHAG